MLPLSEELRQARVEIETWARLHQADDDSDLGAWRALVTIDKAIKILAENEHPTTASGAPTDQRAKGGDVERTFQPAITYIPERVKALRYEEPDICWRPTPDWRSVCIKDLGHDGPCGWGVDHDQRTGRPTPIGYVCFLTKRVFDHGDVRCCGQVYPDHRPTPVVERQDRGMISPDISELVDALCAAIGATEHTVLEKAESYKTEAIEGRVERSQLRAEVERLRVAVKSAWTMTEAAQMNGERPGWVDAEELRHVLSGATDE